MHSNRRLRTIAAALLAALTTGLPAAHAARTTVWAKTPVDAATGRFDLDELETYNDDPVFDQSFVIPYAQLEHLAQQKLRNEIPPGFSGTVVCTDPCPDVDYRVSIGTDFRFTKPNQPVIHPYGNAWENGVTINLDTQARIVLDVHAEAETWFDETGDIHIPLEVVIGLRATSSAKLWPTIEVTQFDVDATLDDSNVQIHGLNGAAIDLGAKLGTVLGVTPIGGFAGGPIGMGILGAFLGDAAADVAKQVMVSRLTTELENGMRMANRFLDEQVAARVFPAVAQAEAIRSRMLSTPLPGVKRSIAQLQQDWGVTLDVRTHVAGDRLRTVASTRFSAAPNGGALSGKVRFPKTHCEYAEINHPITGHIKAPLKVTGFNDDLRPYLGYECSHLFAAQELSARAYLGANPEAHLESGNPANVLPEWAPTGTTAFTGPLVDAGTYYECGFAITDLPAVGIFEIGMAGDVSARASEIHPERERVMALRTLNALGATVPVLLNSEIQPYVPNAVVLGGEGPDSTKDCPSSREGSGGWQTQFDFDWQLDPETCPQCGFETVLGLRNEVIHVLTTPEALVDSPAFQVLTDVATPVEMTTDALVADVPLADVEVAVATEHVVTESAATDVLAGAAIEQWGDVAAAPAIDQQVEVLAAPSYSAATAPAVSTSINTGAIAARVQALRMVGY